MKVTLLSLRLIRSSMQSFCLAARVSKQNDLAIAQNVENPEQVCDSKLEIKPFTFPCVVALTVRSNCFVTCNGVLQSLIFKINVHSFHFRKEQRSN
jgi:hypothetical protein